MITRITRLKGWKDLIVGRDCSKILKEGHVYELKEFGGEIFMRDLGEHAEMDHHTGRNLEEILSDEQQSFFLTKQEKEEMWTKNS